MIFSKPNKSLELISIHIPKTAGRTFLTALASHYKKRVTTVDKLPGWSNEVNQKKLPISNVPSGIECLHGHFLYKQIEGLMISSDIRLITWFRDPVKRVISNYYYNQFENIQRMTDIHNPVDRTITFEEYVLKKSKQNLMSKWIAGREIKDFDFIGNVDWFDDDLDVLRSILGWKKPLIFVDQNVGIKSQNRSLCKTTEITEDMIELVRELNQKDKKLFNDFWELRKINYFEKKGYVKK